jgi:hypothetical protein
LQAAATAGAAADSSLLLFTPENLQQSSAKIFELGRSLEGRLLQEKSCNLGGILRAAWKNFLAIFVASFLGFNKTRKILQLPQRGIQSSTEILALSSSPSARLARLQ